MKVPAQIQVQYPELLVRTPYRPDLPERFRKAGGAWDPRARVWRVPLLRLPKLADLLEGEGVNGALGLVRGVLAAFEKGAEEAKNRLLPEQREDLEALLRALKRAVSPKEGPSGFVLANGTGTGKTYIYAAFLRGALKAGLPALLVVPNEDLARQTAEVLQAFGVEEGKLFQTATYAKLDPEKARGRILVLDEAHLAKNVFGSGASDRGRRAWKAAKNAAFVLYATATPFDRPWESQYLFVPTGFVKEKEFDDFMKEFRVYAREGFGGQKEYYFAGDVEDLARFHKTLKERGFLTKRLFAPPPGMVEYEVPFVDLSREEKALLAEVRKRMREAAKKAPPEERGIVMAQRTFLSRAILERMKLKAALSLVEELLAEGWHVLLFTQYRSEKVLDLSTPEAVEAAWEETEAKGLKGVLHRHMLPALKGLALHLPSSLEVVRERFGHLGEALGFYTGAEREKELRRTKAAWDEGEIRLLVATAQKGGTGLSFHDLRGGRPTAQVVLTLPWTATQLDQILGRVVRVGMKSPVKILLPAAPVPFEKKLATTVAKSLRTLGHAVRGGEMPVPDRVVQAFLYDLANVDPEGFQRLLEEEEDALLEA